MRCGLFGKLPAKRDFISVAAPREFLTPWERWLQGGLSASRARLGADWQEAFLRAPIWRFWLGSDVCGASALGAFMPSVDEVGRYFPLTLVACSTDAAAIPPPELDPQEAWFAAAEGLLLQALDAPPFESLVAALDGLAPPSCAPGRAGGATRLAGGGVLVEAEPAALPERLGAVRRLDHERAYAACSFWWTAGGEGFAPQAIAEQRLPDPYLFASMLTGRFERDGG